MGDHHGHLLDPHGGADSAELAELLDLDAEVLRSYLLEVITWAQQHAARAPRRVLDLGAGTGTGTIALARRFAGADLIAVDQSEDMLTRIRAKARDLGLADRVRTVQADLDAAWPVIEPVDVAWAANVLHHLADPDRVLTDVFAAIRGGGLLAVAEMDSLPRFLPDDLGLGRPGLEARCREALEDEQAAAQPLLGADWGPALERAGFAVVARRTFTVEPASPSSASAGRYARAWLRRIRPALEGRLAADDLATLDTLLDSPGPDGLLQRTDLVVRGSRTAWLARRPCGQVITVGRGPS